LLVAGFHYPDIAADEFDEWYDTEHIPERMGVPGFLNAQRWVATDGSRTALATYDLTSLDVLKHPAYTVRKGDGRTPWSRRIARRTTLFLRLTAEQILPGDVAGPEGAGGLLVELAAGGVTLRDLAIELAAPVLVVCEPGLGTLNHTGLTVEALERQGVACAGLVIGSWPTQPGAAETYNRGTLARLAPVRAVLPGGAGSLTPRHFAEMSRQAFGAEWVAGLV
jgi:hypothetical protein